MGIKNVFKALGCQNSVLNRWCGTLRSCVLFHGFITCGSQNPTWEISDKYPTSERCKSDMRKWRLGLYGYLNERITQLRFRVRLFGFTLKEIGVCFEVYWCYAPPPPMSRQCKEKKQWQIQDFLYHNWWRIMTTSNGKEPSYLVNFPIKLYENETIGLKGGRASLVPPPDPPMAIQ